MYQGTASEATLLAVLAAKERALRQISLQQPLQEKSLLAAKLVAYTSSRELGSSDCLQHLEWRAKE